MSKQTSLSYPSLRSTSTQCGENDEDDLTLSQEIPTQSLYTHLQRFESGDERLSWRMLMEWFVEAVIGIDSFRSEHPTARPLTFDNIRIDASSTIFITFPSSQQPSISGSLSSDISTFCTFFLRVHRTLEDQHQLILPLDYKQEDVVFARIMVALVEHFVPSDPLHPNSSSEDHFQYFLDCFRSIPKSEDRFQGPFPLYDLAESFTRFVLHPQNRNSLIPANHPLQCADAAESSKQILDAVKKVKQTHSMEAVRNVYHDWEEWVTMMEMVEQNVLSLADLSFLQTPCFRSTLESLQTKHQLQAFSNQLEKNSGILSLSNEIYAHTPPPFDSDLSINATNVSSSAISTEMSLPSELSSSDVPTHSSGQLVFSTHSIIRHSQHILSTIHSLKTRPRPKSFPWNIRQYVSPESDFDCVYQPRPHFVDQDEKFDTSLFDETDDLIVVSSLRRCRAVVEATQSTKCVVDVNSFRNLLISALHSSNPVIETESRVLFFKLVDLDKMFDDPLDVRFASLRKAFHEGTFWEKMTLLRLWARWFDFQRDSAQTQNMRTSDFDFKGFLAADLRDTLLFDEACLFIGRFFLYHTALISFDWKMDFLLSFEKRHQMMSRLSNCPSSSSDHEGSRPDLRQLAIILGSFLSRVRGYDFPSELTELITIDLNFNPATFTFSVNPAFFLSYTSINPRHRHSFFPMDLMFERTLRDNPNLFFNSLSSVSVCTSRKFLHTPSIGLHSLLLRSPKLTLDKQATMRLVYMLFVHASNQDTTQSDILTLFRCYPPPRLIDTLLGLPPRHIGTPPTAPPFVRLFDVWVRYLSLFRVFGVYTAPFGACASLVEVFKMLAPFDSSMKRDDLDMLRDVGEIVMSLHWLSIPVHFDSPLLCHLPSLAGAQRGGLQKLSSHSGIPSLLTTHNTDSDWERILSILRNQVNPNDAIQLVSFNYSPIELYVLDFFMKNLQFRFPALVSASFEFFLRFVSSSSHSVRIHLLKQGLLDRIVVAVSNSSFLDDYEKGIAVIGILLTTIRRDRQKRRLRTFDFHRHLNADRMALTECEETRKITVIYQDFADLSRQTHQKVVQNPNLNDWED
ncbi:hypothetical protein BLNAU_12160 [Blattamonas nauphoetae]|uniref:Uncharacterized protein n=1 Tax=Blattamonas nauphoetae TaxID=2049346 RepID=A0ABQ9XPW6_9EUKA|nr:hypothetical protein BLNAU_12160 [Blattamonas nauphoetae]